MNFLDERLPPRFWDKVTPEPNSGCWLWTGASNKTDYGVFRMKGGARLAHRVALAAVQFMFADLVVDHRCHNTRCVNPSHLRQVTQERNAQMNHRSLRSHCAKGHEFTPENTYRTPDGRGRKCRRCHANKQANLNARAKEAK